MAKSKNTKRRVVPARSEVTRPGALGPLHRLHLRQRSTVPLPEGDLGYVMVRPDDCLRAAIATAIQVPSREIPDPRLDQRVRAGEDPETVSQDAWDRITRWLAGRGLKPTFHTHVPGRRRWIAVCRGQSDEEADAFRARWDVPADDLVPFQDHCIVMSYGHILFDPACGIPTEPGMRLRRWDSSDLMYGITFDRKDQA